MTRKYLATWRNVVSSASAITLIFSSLLSQSAEAVTSNPEPVCIEAACSVTFAYSGDSYSWSPPTGATSVTFDIQGAQGGSVGGKGGRVTGKFITAPTSLTILVGGSGNLGSGAAGGFNGGGASGTGFGDEGSGGGATDIRSGSGLASRVAIAAGGGGGGGAIGGPGGIGGGLQGYAGEAAQSEGGSGGTQTYGGRGGLAYGGTAGTDGVSGAGGIGGSSGYAAGGGGGGGLFGGGGGGATLEDCCYGSGAGGGAGGSSFSSASVISSPVHTLGFRSGNGFAKISYLAPPAVTIFATASMISNQDGIAFALTFNQSVTGLATTDFSQPENACSTLALSGSAASYTLTLSGCPDGNHSVALASNSVFGAAAGPIQPVNSNSMLLDSTSPKVTFSSPASPSGSANPSFQITFSESVSGLAAGDITFDGAGCLIDALSGSGTTFALSLKSCGNGALAKVTLLANSVTDAAGNSGPSQNADSNLVTIDLEAPSATWTTTSSSGYALPSFEINFSEPVIGLEIGDFDELTASGCALNLTEITAGTNYSIQASNCGYGQVQLELRSGSFTDVATNPGANSQSASFAYAHQPVATPTATPTPTPTPTVEVVAPPIGATPEPPRSADPVVAVDSSPIEAAPIEPPTIEAAPTQVTAVEESPVAGNLPPIVETRIIAEASAPPAAQSTLETPGQLLPQEAQSIPIQVMRAAAQDAAKPDLIGWIYLAIAMAGAAAVSVGVASLAGTLRLRRRLFTS